MTLRKKKELIANGDNLEKKKKKLYRKNNMKKLRVYALKLLPSLSKF